MIEVICPPATRKEKAEALLELLNDIQGDLEETGASLNGQDLRITIDNVIEKIVKGIL